MNLTELRLSFVNEFGGSPESVRIFFSPGRINLIGEHLDYNGGYVLPCALSTGTFLMIRKREDELIPVGAGPKDRTFVRLLAKKRGGAEAPP